MTDVSTGMQIEQSTDSEISSPGATLVHLRTARNLTIAEVAQRLKYSVRQIESLERDDFAHLPGMTFVRGMIRSYAKLLDADPGIVLRQLERRHVPDYMTVDLRESRIPFPDGKKKRTTRLYATLTILFMLGAALVGYELQSGNSMLDGWIDGTITAQTQGPARDAKDVPHVASAASADIPVAVIPVAVAENPPAETGVITAPVRNEAVLPSSGSKRIALQFERESWVEIRQADGKILHSQLNGPGTRQYVEGIPPFALVIGNAPSVRLFYNDQPVDLRPHFKVDVARFTLE